jgi:hypothetical protein
VEYRERIVTRIDTFHSLVLAGADAEGCLSGVFEEVEISDTGQKENYVSIINGISSAWKINEPEARSVYIHGMRMLDLTIFGKFELEGALDIRQCLAAILGVLFIMVLQTTSNRA